MSASFPFSSARPRPPAEFGLAFAVTPNPILVHKSDEDAVPAATRRTKLWELADSLHCSIIGTCLSSAELRRILGKANLVEVGKTDHELHGQGVTLAGRHALPGKLLHKALDERHRLTLKRFDRAKTEAEVRALWGEARGQGDIPGGYWAVLTHPATSAQLIRDVFGEVHMLSHLVGAANRADIRRLSELESEKARLEDKVARQQAQLCDAVGRRDARIRDLSALLASRLAERETPAAETADRGSALADLAADLQRRLDGEQRRRETLESRLAQTRTALSEERVRREAAEARERQLSDELAALEASLSNEAAGDGASEAAFGGRSVLYVGGHPHLVGHLRSVSRRLGADFEHHDGGVDERNGLLAGLVSRADLVLFPVDCISHEAALGVKRLCRQVGKPFIPLRSAGLASFVSALCKQGSVTAPA